MTTSQTLTFVLMDAPFESARTTTAFTFRDSRNFRIAFEVVRPRMPLSMAQSPTA